MTGIYKINRPSHLRWAIGFDFIVCPLARLRPTICSIIIIVIIIVIGETKPVYHDCGIIAQTIYSGGKTACLSGTLRMYMLKGVPL